MKRDSDGKSRLLTLKPEGEDRLSTRDRTKEKTGKSLEEERRAFYFMGKGAANRRRGQIS